MIELLRARRSIRRYTDRAIGPQKLECIIALGYPAEKREPVPPAELKDAKVHRNTYASRGAFAQDLAR